MTSLNLLDNYTESPDHRADYLETENIIDFHYVFHSPDYRADYLETQNIIDFDILIQDLIISLYNIQI